MFSNVVNSMIAGALAAVLYYGSEVPLEMALQAGLLVSIACLLADVSCHLRKE